MKQITLFLVLLSCFYINHVHSANLPGPLVYVVTPSSRPPQIDMGRAVPFYYHNWKRMDTPGSSTPVTTTQKTPDLIFAEFESNNNNKKSIRKLLEKEKIERKTTSTTTTTSRPIYVPDEDTSVTNSNYGLPPPTTEKLKKTDMTDYFALYNNLYNSGPMYVPSAPTASVPTVPPMTSTTSTTSTTTTTTTDTPINNVENIWHIIDNEKHDEYSGKWNEEPVNSEQTSNEAASENSNQSDDEKSNEDQTEHDDTIDDNFALPGFGTNPGNGGENESRAIRTEPNIRFPYVNLKPFKMRNFNSKKGNNMISLDNFTEVKNPIRGEVQDAPIRQPIDRYNPAQPYLPDYGIGSKAKQSSAPPAPAAPAPPPRPPPVKAVANLVPPPLPPAPKLTADDFPTPSTYESFPPYAPGGADSGPSFSFPPTGDSGADSSSGDDNSPPSAPSSGYRYKPPAPPALSFVPTLPPVSKPFSGYSYDKPPMQDYSPPSMDMGDKPDMQIYHYNKPASPPASPPQDLPSPSYGHHEAPPPSYQPESDYPDLIFDKPHGGMNGGDAMKGNDMGMMPPPPPADLKPDLHGPPSDDHGFPHDFPGDFKYGHDFDDHDHDHHYHYHPTTTTTSTTEMPRVNRFSYYYLGKKLYYLPLYFSVYFVVYVGALIIKAVLRHKITYPNSFRPNDQTASFFSKRSIESHLSNDNLHEITGRVTRAIATAAEKYISDKSKDE